MTYTYAAVEHALAEAFDIGRDRLGMFRGRIKHLQRIGLVPSSPGPGKRIQYSFEDAAKWALALELGQFGSDPTENVRAVDELWPIAAPSAIRSPAEWLVACPDLLSDVVQWTAMARVTSQAGIATAVGQWPERLMVIYLGGLYARLETALGEGMHDAA